MYTPSMIASGISPLGWLNLIEKNFGKDYLTDEQRELLLEKGIEALVDSL
jgi:hypothetical protein